MLASTIHAQVRLPKPDESSPIVITADEGTHWTQGSYEVWVLQGSCSIAQGASSARSQEGVVWLESNSSTEGGRDKVIAYLEGNVELSLDRSGAHADLADKTWLGRFVTASTIQVRPKRIAPAPDQPPAIYQRGFARREPAVSGAIRRTEYNQPIAVPVGGALPQPGTRRIFASPRGEAPTQIKWERQAQTNQAVGTVTGGINLVIDGLPNVGSIDVSTDRLVIWTYGLEQADLRSGSLQPENVPLEIYMEGNIEFRQGDRIIYADRMYYDVNNRVGMVLNAELVGPVPSYDGLVRLRAAVLQEAGEGRFFAQNVFITSSLMGAPTYRLQAESAYFEDFQRPVVDPFTGAPLYNPDNPQEPLIEHQRLATAENNVLYVEDVPVFYWPIIATDVTRPTFYLRRLQFKNDSVFGTQVLTTWDAYQLLGIRNHPPGTDWDISLDFMSERGLGHGTTFTYLADRFFGIPGPTAGLFDYWGIQDHGHDNLGLDRRDVTPPKDYRYRLLWQHREVLPGDFELSAGVDWASDRYFFQEYFQREWEQFNEQETYINLKRTHDNISWNLMASGRIDNWYTQSEWYPRLDHFWLGQPLFNDTFTWYEHSSAGYTHLLPATAPPNPAQDPFFQLLPWEKDRQGERFITRQEIDLPFQLGALKVVPYALGELGHWGEDLNGQDIQRAYGQLGLRANIPFWQVFPGVESDLLNLHGLAHKINFNGEVLYADASQDLSQFPLYDPINTDFIETFQHRFSQYTFGVPVANPTIPPRFDAGYYAVRSGLAGWVSSPSFEIAEDLMAVRLGAEQRWQTKRGFPGRREIIDWITLDTNMTLFPDPNRDNFGEVVGLMDYDFRWFVGDRFTLTSEGIFDFFDDGQRIVNVGIFLSRPPRGSLYVGLDLVGGPVNNNVVSASYSYLMSPKWISSFGMSYDIGHRNIGENLLVTRIGESFLVSGGFVFNTSQNNFGAVFSIEPRFLSRQRSGTIAGARIPPAGALGLE